MNLTPIPSWLRWYNFFMCIQHQINTRKKNQMKNIKSFWTEYRKRIQEIQFFRLQLLTLTLVLTFFFKLRLPTLTLTIYFNQLRLSTPALDSNSSVWVFATFFDYQLWTIKDCYAGILLEYFQHACIHFIFLNAAKTVVIFIHLIKHRLPDETGKFFE